MNQRRVLKWQVPINDSPTFVGSGRVVHVDCQNNDPSYVQIWTDEANSMNWIERGIGKNRKVQVFGTAQIIPEDAVHLGSVIPVGVKLVWHVYELRS